MTPERITIHHSASKFGDVAMIDDWHRDRGFRCIGYHAVILNGKRHTASIYDPYEDGLIEHGRPYDKQGAHVRGDNKNNLGLCLIGAEFTDYTVLQLNSLLILCRLLCKRFGIPFENIKGHKDYDHGKPICPDLSLDALRAMVSTENYRIGKWTG